MEFSSERMEIEYLMAAAPHEVLQYLDKKGASHQPSPWARECVSKELEASLLARNERLVDVALARVCRNEVVEQIIARHTVDWRVGDGDDSDSERDPGVMAAALSNRVAMTYLFMSRWLGASLTWVARHGSPEHLQALFLNPSVPNEVVDHALDGSHAFAGLDQERRREMVYHALKSKPALTEPKSTGEDFDLAGHGTQDCVWRLFATVDPRDQGMANVLAEALPTLPELQAPSEWEGAPDGVTKTDWKEHQVTFLAFVFDRWRVEGNETSHEWVPQRVIRELIASRAPYYNEGAMRLVIDHPDVYVRRGYYRGLENETLENLKKYHERDGDAFCASAVYNPFFFQRSKREIAVWFAERVRECAPPDNEFSVPVGSTYCDVQEELFKKAPEKYFESSWEAEDPDEYAASHRRSSPELDAAEQRDRVLLTKVGDLSAVARNAVQSRNWLMMALAAAVGFIVAKL